MPQRETIERIERYFAAFNNHDLDGMLGLLDDEVVHDINQGGREIGREKFSWFLAKMRQHYDEQVDDLAIMTTPERGRRRGRIHRTRHLQGNGRRPAGGARPRLQHRRGRLLRGGRRSHQLGQHLLQSGRVDPLDGGARRMSDVVLNQLYTLKSGTLRAILNGWGVWPPLSVPIDEIRGCPVAFRPLRAVSSHGFPALVQDRAVEIAGRTGQRQSRFGARRPNGSDKQAKPVLPVREDMLHGSAYRRLPRICPRAGQWH